MSKNNGKSDTVEIIGAGWGRTGTASLKKALEILGHNPTYHMFEIMQRPEHADFWIRVADGQPYDFDEVFVCDGGKVKYTATVDFPSAKYWKEQLDRYPNAKVILTSRDPEKWYKSAMETIFSTMNGCPTQPFGFKVLNFFQLGPVKGEFITKVIARDTLAHDWSKDGLIRRYKAAVDRVMKECPKEKLLVFDVAEGWEPLCKFLGKPIPKEPFPHVNDAAEMKVRLARFNMLGWGIFITLLSLPVVAAVAVKRFL